MSLSRKFFVVSIRCTIDGESSRKSYQSYRKKSAGAAHIADVRALHPPPRSPLGRGKLAFGALRAGFLAQPAIH